MMFKFFCFLIIALPGLGCSGNAVTGDKYWSRAYGTKWNYTVHDAANVEEGFIITGFASGLDNKKDEDLFAAKIDSRGKMVWNKRYGTSKNERGYSIYKLHSGLVIAGMQDSGSGTGRDAWILKIDEEGDLIWNRVIGGYRDDEARVVKPDLNNYIVLGSTASYGRARQSIWVLLLDWSGNVVWDKTFGDGPYNAGVDIIVEKDGYIIAGNSISDTYSDVVVFKIDKKGNIIWERVLGGNGTNNAEAMKAAGDGYIIAGAANKSFESDRDAWILKVDRQGNPVWNRTIGGGGDDAAYSVQMTNNGYIVSGSTNSYPEGEGYKAWLFEVDRTGNLLWSRTFSDAYAARSVLLIYDEYLVAGNKRPSAAGGGIWLIKTGKKGEITE